MDDQWINWASWILTLIVLISKFFMTSDLEKLLFSSIIRKLGYVRQVEMGVLIAKIVRKFASVIAMIKANPDKLLNIIAALETSLDSILKRS